ncbi:MAG TPA: HAD family phosphatase [Bryobacteraceae bacterium]|jgi:putative hydrolase of the HAD superfamily
MYRAILLDLGRVLIHFDFSAGYRALENLCPYAEAEIRRRIAATDLAVRFETGLIEPRDFHAQLCALLDLNVDYERFCDIWNSIFREVLVPESMVEGLAHRYRLVLVSNTNQIHFEMVQRRYPVLRHFHQLALSYRVKAMKPRPEIFLEAVRLAGCRAEECFYADDIPAFAEAARKLGIDAVTFESAAQLSSEMRRRSIAWE